MTTVKIDTGLGDTVECHCDTCGSGTSSSPGNGGWIDEWLERHKGHSIRVVVIREGHDQ